MLIQNPVSQNLEASTPFSETRSKLKGLLSLTMQFLLLTLSIILNVSGYLIFKQLSGKTMDFQWYVVFIGGLLLGAIGTFCFTQALKTIKLSTAYPVFAGGTCLLILILSTIFFKERLSPLNLVGVALTLGGIYFITRI